MTGKKIDNDISIISRTPMIIPVVIGSIVLIVTEYKIYMFKKCVDSKHQLDEEEEEERNCKQHYCKENSNRIITLIVIAIVFTFVLSAFLYRFNVLSQNDLDVKRLRIIGIPIQNLVMQNIIPLILIVKNQKLYHFFEAQILTILRLSKFKKNKIEPMIELNVL